MSPQDQIKDFAQDVYLTIKNRLYDDIDSTDGQTYVAQIIRHVNMFADELELVTGTDGKPVDWWFSRENGANLGTAQEGSSSIDLPSTVKRVLTSSQRYVQVLQDGTPVSNWLVVNPKDITNRTDRYVENMCAVVGRSLVFSRAFKDTEQNGVVVGDVVNKLPRMSTVNTKILTTVDPRQLLVLGVSKNATLADIVQGKLSPSYVQKYNDLLEGAIAQSRESSGDQVAARQSFGFIQGVY